ncbi:MAG: methyltransferase family protein [Nitrospinota bacterium]
MRWGRAADVVLAAFWGLLAYLLAYRNLFEWAGGHNLLQLQLFTLNTLIAALFIFRRRSRATSERPLDWVATVGAILLSFSLHFPPASPPGPLAILVSQVVQGLALVGIIAAVASLGRSFGLVPADRGLQRRGLYRLVRHPMYASEMLFYLGFLAGNPSRLNVLKVLGIAAGLTFRARVEEELLCRTSAYEDYRRQVPHRVIPFLF